MTKALLVNIQKAAFSGDMEKLAGLLAKENFHTVAEIVNVIPKNKTAVFSSLPPEQQAKIVVALNYRSKRTIIPKLPDEMITEFLQISDEDDAADILQFLPDPRRIPILKKLHEEKRSRIEKLLKYQPESAGGIMNLNYILVKPDFTLTDVASKVERYTNREKKSPLIVCIRDDGKIVGYIPYRNLILAKPESTVKEVTKKLLLIPVKTKQRKLIRLLAKKRLDIVGVVDQNEQLVGIIRISDLARLIESEATENIYRFAGVSREEDMLDPASVTVKHRYKWLIINLATAFLAAFVVALFEGTIAQMAILAAFMPIVAGMGGNAGTQTLAVVVRGIALGELEWVNGSRVIWKEVIAGFWNGLIVAVITIPVSLFFTNNIGLALVLGAAMIINLVIAGFFGALIPISLRLLHIDPAVASSIFVTTATDIIGFLAFLGLATLLLL